VSVGIDAMILVYAGLVPSNDAPPNSHLVELGIRAKLLLYQLTRDHPAIILPTIAISELLVPVPPSKTGALIAALTEQFVCPTFDLPAAAIAADLWARHKKLPRESQYKNRHVLRADAMIIASVKAAGATAFYTNDKTCRTLASLVIPAHGLPDKPTNLEDIFVEGDIRRGEEPPPSRKKRSQQ
jgi:hypothetical protein